MNVTLYSCSDAFNKINKRLIAKSTKIPCTIKIDTSLMNPTISITLPISWHDFNYVQFENGYTYIVEDVVKKMGGVYDVNLQIDALYTFRNEINNLTIEVTRSESHGIENILDNEVPLITSRIIESQNIGAFDTKNAKTYLCVSGG